MGCRLVLLGLLIGWEILFAGLARAQPSFERRAWGQADGAPQSAYGIAQDADGLLWFATASGLYNFDGVRYTQVQSVYGHALRSNNFGALVATRDGIAVGYQFGGVSVFSRRAVRHYGSADGLPTGGVPVLFMDKAGALYASTSLNIARLDPGSETWTTIGVEAMQKRMITWAGADDGGTVWATTDTHVYVLPKGAKSFRRFATTLRDSYPAIIGGKLVANTGIGRPTRLSLDEPPVVFALEVATRAGDAPFEGPDGTWWAWLKGGTSLLRADSERVLHVVQDFEGTALPGRMVMRSLVDRENNLWITTPEGVERYRAHRLHAYHLPYAAVELHVGRGLADDLLVTNREEGPVQRLAGGGMTALPGVRGVSAMHRQDAGSVWLGGSGGIFHLTAGEVRHWPMPRQISTRLGVQGIVTDKAGNVLVSIVRQGVYRFLDGSWTKVSAAGSLAADTPIIMMTGASGRTYLGYTAGRLAELTPDGIRMIPAALGDAVGNILSLLEHEGRLFAGGDRGVAMLEGGKAIALRPYGMPAFAGVSGMVIDRGGSLWMHGPKGLMRVPTAGLQGFLAGQSAPVQWEVFNFEDGLRGQVSQIRPLPSLGLANDGKVYYATSAQVGWIDPAAIRRNGRAPTVLVTSVRAGDRNLPLAPGMTVPAGTTGLEIHFTATALSIPERVRFRYRLAGVDQEWQQPGQERAARYTNLGPGAYRFEVTAANEDGVWNETGASLEFDIAPAFWQTYWFRAIAIVLLVSLGLALYRWRIAAAARRAAEKTAARIEERERIARNLHDNLLQGVQGLILSCHAILMRMPAGTNEEKKLAEVLARADLMIEETRDEVMDLRRESPPHHLVHRLRQSIAKLGPAAAANVEVEWRGRIDRVQSGSATEIFYTLQEAITNAVRHAGAGRIRVNVEVSESGLHASVRDDGCGMAGAIVENGRAGHWGLVGMRERIVRLGGTLVIDSRPGEGTTVEFSVPARSAFGASDLQPAPVRR